MKPVLILSFQGEKLEELLRSYLNEGRNVYCVTNEEGRIESPYLSEIVCDLSDSETLEIVETLFAQEVASFSDFIYLFDTAGVDREFWIQAISFYDDFFKLVTAYLDETSKILGVSLGRKLDILHEQMQFYFPSETSSFLYFETQDLFQTQNLKSLAQIGSYIQIKA